jgi:CHAT domain-containing protein
VISSYTPTINTLLRDVPQAPSTNSFKMMVVVQAQTPGQRSLPFTVDELRKIETHVPDKCLVKLVPGSLTEVISHFSTTSIVHFACHGQHDKQSPLKSGLFLQDGQLQVSKIMQQAIPNASLAFLNACETAMGDENLPDEVLHLGATLLFAGFRGVVATMWWVL